MKAFHHTPGEVPPEKLADPDSLTPREREDARKRVLHLHKIIEKGRAKRRRNNRRNRR